MKFKFSTKRYSIFLIFILVLFTFFLVVNILDLLDNYQINNSYEYLRPKINVVILYFVFVLVFLVFSIYALRYLVIINNDILIIRLIFKKKNYDLNNLTSYEVLKYDKNVKFIVWFGRKRRTIVTTTKEPLNTILNDYLN